jgi:hypothetical protein
MAEKCIFKAPRIVWITQNHLQTFILPYTCRSGLQAKQTLKD